MNTRIDMANGVTRNEPLLVTDAMKAQILLPSGETMSRMDFYQLYLRDLRDMAQESGAHMVEGASFTLGYEVQMANAGLLRIHVDYINESDLAEAYAEHKLEETPDTDSDSINEYARGIQSLHEITGKPIHELLAMSGDELRSFVYEIENDPEAVAKCNARISARRREALARMATLTGEDLDDLVDLSPEELGIRFKTAAKRNLPEPTASFLCAKIDAMLNSMSEEERRAKPGTLKA